MTNGWFTTTELEQSYGISKRLAYTWFSLLECVKLARRAPGGKHGILLFKPDAKEFLVARRMRYGKPRREPNDAELAIIKDAVANEISIEQVAISLRASITQASNWIEDYIIAEEKKDNNGSDTLSS